MSEVDTAAAEKPARSVGRTIARNTAFGIGAQIALKLANFLFNVLVVRQLGGSEFGQYSIVFAWAGLFSFLGDLGVSQYLTREVARNPERTKELFWDTVALRFFLAMLTSVVTIGGAILLTDYSPELIFGIGLFTLTYFFQILIAPLNSVLTGYERIDLVSVLNVIMQVIFMLFCTLFLLLNLNFRWLLLAGSLTLPFVLVLQIWMMRRNNLGPPRFQINRDMWWSLIRFGMPFGFTQIALNAAFRVDTIVLSGHVSDTEVGWYNIAYGLILMVLSLATSFSTAILPTLAREFVTNPATVRPWYYNSTKVLLFLALPLVIGTTLTAHKIIAFLYQPEIAPAAVALMILAWDLPFVMYHAVCGNIANSIMREKSGARIFVSLGVTSLLLNLLLVPRFGIIGSSFATVLTDAIGAAQFYFMFRREFGAGLQGRKLIRLAAAAVLMGGLVYLIRDFNLFLIVILAGVFYLAAAWASAAFSHQEREQFLRLAAKMIPNRTRA